MPLCLYFKVHQPFQLKPFSPMDVDVLHHYDNTVADKACIDTVADNCYLPANQIMLSLIREHQGRFKVSYAISGTTIELLQLYRPDVIDSFRELVNTGCVDMLAGTYYHSLSFLHARKEFERQVIKHRHCIKKTFGIQPTVFCNTALIYNNELAGVIARQGFTGILCEGMGSILQQRNGNQVYAVPGTVNGAEGMGLLLRHAALSDDIAFRFDDRHWNEYPLTPEKFASWIHMRDHSDVLNLFMDYETFGIHKKKETGIFDFLNTLPAKVLAQPGYTFDTAPEVLQAYPPKDIYHVPQTISWEDKSAPDGLWCDDVRQHNTLKKIYSLENMVLHTGCEKTMDTWGRLQTADYFYYTSQLPYGNLYTRPHMFATQGDVFQSYSNMITDFEITLIRQAIEKNKKQLSLRSMAAGILL